jgi:hypothetical protein
MNVTCGMLLTPNLDTHTMPLSRPPDWTEFVTHQLYQQKQGMETVAAAFTDHMAVILCLGSEVPFQERG